VASVFGFEVFGGTGKFDGPMALFDDALDLQCLGRYVEGKRDGPFKAWDGDGKMLFYAQYQNGNKYGVTCYFKAGQPWLLQEWTGGQQPAEEYLLVLAAAPEFKRK